MIYNKQNFNLFEQELIYFLLKQSDQHQILFQQWRNIVDKKLKFSGVGFFINYQIADHIEKTTDLAFRIDSINIEIKELKYGIGATLFVKNGCISMLEGYSFGEEIWPDEFEVISIKSI